jgi:hypothetical protein
MPCACAFPIAFASAVSPSKQGNSLRVVGPGTGYLVLGDDRAKAVSVRYTRDGQIADDLDILSRTSARDARRRKP